MGGALLPTVVIGGVTYYLVTQDNKPVPLPGQPGYVQPNYGSTTGQIMTGGAGQGYTGSDSDYLYNGGQSGFAGVANDPYVQQKIDLLAEAAEASYRAMDAAGRNAAANQLNQKLDLNPPLDGNDSWETVARVAGGAGGAAVCNAIPGVGTAASPLCAIAGSYLGVKLEDWISSEMPALKAWVNDNVVGGVRDVIDDIGDWLSDLF
jgi:hypothetical protein